MYYSVSESGPRHVADTERLQAMWDEYSPGNSHFADHTGKADDVMLVDEGATALEYLYGKLEYSPKARSAVPLEHGTEYKFDQELIFNEISNPHAGGTFGDLEAAKWGRIYVPHKCADATST